MRTTILILSLLLLTGCYESREQLLDASQARQPITTYQDWNYGSGDHRYHARLNPRSDGWYDYEEAKIDNGNEGTWKHHTVLLNYLTNAGGFATYVFSTWDDTEKAYIYGVVAIGANGFWQSVTPSCDPVSSDEKWYQSDVDAAKRAGADVKNIDDMEDICLFHTHDELFAAMSNIVNQSGFPGRVTEAAK